MSRIVDVGVVGAGPAGSACAYRLAHAGFSVAIFERTPFPRTKVCGEYLNAGARNELAAIGLDAEVRACASAIEGIRLHTQGMLVELPFPTGAWSIARAELDAILLRHAQHAGADLKNARVEGVSKNGRTFALRFRDASGNEDTLEARTVVGADGVGSLVARDLRLNLPQGGSKRFAIGGHYAGFGELAHFIEMYVRGQNYFAINPLGADRANVMVIVEETQLHEWRGAIDERLRETARELGGGRQSVDRVVRIGRRVAVGPLSQRSRAAAVSGGYLVGDAAGFLDPFTGQGVFLALRTAALASGAIARELAPSASTLQPHVDYVREHRRIFASRRRVASLVTLLIKTPWLARRAARNLQRSAALREIVMNAVSGDGSASSLLSPKTLLRLVA